MCDFPRLTYEYLKERKYSFDDLTDAYDRVISGDFSDFRDISEFQEIPETDRQNVCVNSLKRVYDEKEYDKDTLKDIKHYKDSFQYYPDPKEPDFAEQLSLKREMLINYVPKTLKNISESCNRDFFELAPHQVFLKNLISKNTPYNGLLIFHGVGVGKTCSGVTIAENFKDTYKQKDKRIIVLSSQNIKIGWKKTIYDPKKGTNQCTGDTYESEDMNRPQKNPESKAKRQIKQYYELHGYASFANTVKRTLQKHLGKDIRNAPEDVVKPWIQKYYSDRVLIVDEVHNIRSGDQSDVRNTIYYIELVIKYSKNLKLILLTANPMYNMADEIVWILNMLLMNDGRPTLNEKEVFDDGLTLLGIQKIKQVSRGYVSYLRGENPVSFPVRLYPRDRQITEPGSSISVDIYGKPIPQSKQLSFLSLYSSDIKGFQKQVYERMLQSFKDQDDGSDSKQGNLQIQDENLALQVGNIVYPTLDEVSGDIKSLYGSGGLERCFKVSKGIYEYKEETPEFLDEDVIGKYSAKIETILRCIRESDGIVFIYTNWIASGVVPLVLALEQNGYAKYDGSSLLKGSRKREPISIDGVYQSDASGEFTQAKYMVISGKDGFGGDLASELRVVASSENANGSQIKVIVGSSVAAEGLDFKNIRSIHVLEPWHNLNKIEQVIGRGVRNCSHRELSESERNVTIYLHNLRQKGRETVDTHLYRYSERKSQIIGQVEMVLKANAIDRHLFRNMNRLTKMDVEPFRVKPAKRTAKSYLLIPKDKPYTRVCSFQPVCEYLEDTMNLEKVSDRRVNRDTFRIVYSQGIIDVYIKRIAYFVKSVRVFTISEIIALISEYQRVEIDLLYRALYQMTRDKYQIHTSDGDGYLVQIDNFFAFQPSYNSDPLIPYYYRIHRGRLPPLKRILQISEKRLTNVETDDIVYSKDKIMMTLDSLKTFTYTEQETYVMKKFPLSERAVLGYRYDRLYFEQRKVLGYLTLMFTKQLHKLTDYDKIYHRRIKQVCEYCEQFQYGYLDDSDIYTFSEKDPKKVKGFTLFHSRNKRMYGYSLEGETLSLLNEIDSRQLVEEISGIKDSLQFTNRSWAYMIYSERYKSQNNGMVCKVVLKTDRLKARYTYPPGPGSVIRNTNRNDNRILSNDPTMFLETEFKDKMDVLGDSEIQEIRDKRSTILTSAMIEMFFRDRNECLSQDIVWLKYS